MGYLRPAKKRNNLTVVTNAHAEKVLFDGKRATGVRYNVKGTSFEAAAGREVIMSAGAIGSPQILMISGLGPAAHLKDHGIDVVHELKGMGQNLQDHMQVRMVLKINRPISLNDSVNFDNWQLNQSENLRFLMDGAIERLTHCLKTHGDYTRGVRYAHRWLELDRLNENAYRELIDLLDKSGYGART